MARKSCDGCQECLILCRRRCGDRHNCRRRERRGCSPCTYCKRRNSQREAPRNVQYRGLDIPWHGYNRNADLCRQLEHCRQTNSRRTQGYNNRHPRRVTRRHEERWDRREEDRRRRRPRRNHSLSGQRTSGKQRDASYNPSVPRILRMDIIRQVREWNRGRLDFFATRRDCRSRFWA